MTADPVAGAVCSVVFFVTFIVFVTVAQRISWFLHDLRIKRALARPFDINDFPTIQGDDEYDY